MIKISITGPSCCMTDFHQQCILCKLKNNVTLKIEQVEADSPRTWFLGTWSERQQKKGSWEEAIIVANEGCGGGTQIKPKRTSIILMAGPINPVMPQSTMYIQQYHQTHFSFYSSKKWDWWREMCYRQSISKGKRHWHGLTTNQIQQSKVHGFGQNFLVRREVWCVAIMDLDPSLSWPTQMSNRNVIGVLMGPDWLVWTMQNLGVYRLSDASDFVEMHKNGLGITNKPMTMLFMAVPAINKKPVEGQCKKLKSSSCIPRTFYKLLEEQSTTIQE